MRSIRRNLPWIPGTILTLALAIAPGLGQPAATAATPAAGFAPPSLTLFAPMLALVPPGPDRAARAISLFDRQIGFYRRFAFHPQLTPELQKVADQMPPRGATLLLAPRLYARDDIPWDHAANRAHRINVIGAPAGADYLFALARRTADALEPNHFASDFTLNPIPADDDPQTQPASVIGGLRANLRLDGYDPHNPVDVPAAMLPLCYGDLQGPWDTAPGNFNHHDRAALDRLRGDLPALYTHLRSYLRLRNVLDEFAPAADDTPTVLVNLDAEFRPHAFDRFPHFAAFYSRIAPRVEVAIAVEDGAGHQWARIRFDRGRLRLIFMDAGGRLRPFDARFAPAGPPLAPEAVLAGGYRVTMRLHYTRFRLTFGLDDLRLITSYRREPDAVKFVARMPAPPVMVAPPIVKQVVRMLAERFMATMATGHGGMEMVFDSRSTGGTSTELAARWRAELRYSPGLQILVKVADSIADAHNRAVRDDERRMGEELFDAMLRDYNAAKPRLLVLDRTEAPGTGP